MRKLLSRPNCTSYCWGSAWQGAADTALAQPDSDWTKEEDTQDRGRKAVTIYHAAGRTQGMESNGISK